VIGNALNSTDITPLTTVIWESIKSEFLLKDEDLDNPNLACDSIRDNHEKVDELARKIQQTLKDIVTYYNISESAIFADYMANGDSTTHELALLIVKGLKKGFSEASELKQSHPNSFVDVKYLKASDGWVRKKYIYTASGSDNSNGWSSHAKLGTNEVHEREITNITSTCANEDNGKYVFNMQWSDWDKRLVLTPL